MKLDLFLLKGAWPLYELATPPELLAHKNCISGLSNEIHNVSLVQVILEIQAVKVERLKKKLNLLSKTGSFFDCSTLMARISRTIYVPELLYTSLESPNMQLFGGLKTWGVALQSKQASPFE